jgi:hypothetical protein
MASRPSRPIKAVEGTGDRLAENAEPDGSAVPAGSMSPARRWRAEEKIPIELH